MKQFTKDMQRQFSSQNCSLTAKQVVSDISLHNNASQRLENTETLQQVVFEKVPAREIENQIVAG